MENKKTKIILITICLLFVILITYLTIDCIEYEYFSNNETISDNKIKKKTSSLSIMLETRSNTNEYVASTSTSWPTEGYEFNKELSRCENGGELSFDEETKKLQLISDKPEKCYVYFDKYLEFYLNDVLFQAGPNMTWEEWLNSNYSDGWIYKSKITSYNELLASGVNNSYFPMNLSMGFTEDSFYVNSEVKNYAYGLVLFSDKIHCPNEVNSLNDYIISDYAMYLYQFDKIEKILDALDVANSRSLTGDLSNNHYYCCLYYEYCLSPETLIDVEEIDEKGKKQRRRKKLKDIKVGDKVICINPFTLELDTDTVVECDGQMNKKHTCFDNWYFSDGTMITTIHRHRFYNVEKNKFMYMEEWNIGEHGLNINNEKIKLIKHEHIEEEINHCTLFTEKYNNYFANGLLSGNRRSKEIKQNR